MKNQQRQRISAVKGDKKNCGKGPKTGVELRYHDRKEYSKLSKDEKKELSEWRKKSKEKDDQHESQIASLQQTVEELKATIALISTKEIIKEEKKDPLVNPLNQRNT